jgi:acetyl-CoA carboxylase biotin carboxyl carrier protein
MNHEQIEALAAVLKEVPALTEVEVRHAGATLRMRRGGIAASPASDVAAPSAPAVASSPAATSPPKVEVVRASVVGVFHALGGKPVGNGDTVKARQVLGHIETMRLMNDCISPIDGVIEQVFVQDMQPVEWGQPLFEILPGGAR